MKTIYKIIYYGGTRPENPISLGFDSSFFESFEIFKDMIEHGPIPEFGDTFYSLELSKYDLDTQKSEIILLVALELKNSTWIPVSRTYLEEEIDRFYLEAADQDFDNLEEYDNFFMKFHINHNKSLP